MYRFIGNKALSGKLLPARRFTGDPDDADIGVRGDVAERKYHRITWSCLPGPCDRQSARVHMDRCVITIRYAQIPGKELATAEFVR